MTAEVFTFPGGTPPAALPEPAAPPEMVIIEPAMAPEIFTAALARVYVHGPFTRLIWTAPDRNTECPRVETVPDSNIVNARLIVPTECLPAIYDALGKAIAARAAAGA